MQRRSPVGLSDVTPVADDDDDDFINTEFHNQKIKVSIQLSYQGPAHHLPPTAALHRPIAIASAD